MRKLIQRAALWVLKRIPELAAHTHKYDRAGSGGAGTESPDGGSTTNIQTNSGSAGSGDAHNNMQPTMFLPWIIWK